MNADALGILQSWSAPLRLDLALGLTVFVYARGWIRLRSAFPGLISLRRLAAFLGGIFLVWVAIGSPLNAFDDASLTIHMVQHLLLMSIAPPLILLGAPALPLLHGLPQFLARRVIGPLLRAGWVKWLGDFLTRTAIAWLIAALALIVWHIPTVFELALRLPWLHEFEHACFFGAGVLFWWPVVQPWPSVARSPRWIIPLYLFCATLPCDALSGFLVFCDRVVYSSYLSTPRIFGFSPLQDQECAAALMWTCVTIILVVPAVAITIQFLAPQSAELPGAGLAGASGMAGKRLDAAKWKIV
ncbi:MAG TPA: cytochrome c oxidase assembly protein [Candidatus Acidoferrales bacterium]